MSQQTTSLACTCGEVALAVQGEPIISVECLCADCQNAGAQLQTLPGAPQLVDTKGATRFVLYRKDRVQIKSGTEHLREHRLVEDSHTRRVVATCCNTPVFLEFSDGHWLSMYGHLWPESSLPSLEMRTMTAARPKGVELPDDVPNPKAHNVSFYAKLLWAWVGGNAISGAQNRLRTWQA